MCEQQVLDAVGRLVGIDAFGLDDGALEQVGLHLHALAGVGDALLDDAGLRLKLGELADGLADQRRRRGRPAACLPATLRLLPKEVADRGGGHGELAHAVVVGADRGFGRFVERDAADDLLVGGVRPVGLPAGAEELRLERGGHEAVHLRGGDVGGGRVVLREAEMRLEGGVEGGLGGRAGGRKPSIGFTSVLMPANR